MHKGFGEKLTLGVNAVLSAENYRPDAVVSVRNPFSRRYAATPPCSQAARPWVRPSCPRRWRWDGGTPAMTWP
ncbi:MAG: hypothetical protein ACYC5N_01485 [Endomicrobiales bacterium]